MNSVRGFSLIELIMILVLLSLGSVVLVRLYGQSVGSLDENIAFQTGAQAVQQCAEHFLGTRRRVGYSAVASTNCTGLTMPAGYTRALTLSTTTGGTGVCPGAVTVNCTTVLITVSDTPHGIVASGTVMLVN